MRINLLYFHSSLQTSLGRSRKANIFLPSLSFRLKFAFALQSNDSKDDDGFDSESLRHQLVGPPVWRGRSEKVREKWKERAGSVRGERGREKDCVFGEGWRREKRWCSPASFFVWWRRWLLAAQWKASSTVQLKDASPLSHTRLRIFIWSSKWRERESEELGGVLKFDGIKR